MTRTPWAARLGLATAADIATKTEGRRRHSHSHRGHRDRILRHRMGRRRSGSRRTKGRKRRRRAQIQTTLLRRKDRRRQSRRRRSRGDVGRHRGSHPHGSHPHGSHPHGSHRLGSRRQPRESRFHPALPPPLGSRPWARPKEMRSPAPQESSSSRPPFGAEGHNGRRSWCMTSDGSVLFPTASRAPRDGRVGGVQKGLSLCPWSTSNCPCPRGLVGCIRPLFGARRPGGSHPLPEGGSGSRR